MSKRKITLKQFCQLFVEGTVVKVVCSKVEKFSAYTDVLCDGPFADFFVDHCYMWKNYLWVVLE